MSRLDEIKARIKAFDALSPAEMAEATCPAAEAFWDMLDYDLRWCVEQLSDFYEDQDSTERQLLPVYHRRSDHTQEVKANVPLPDGAVLCKCGSAFRTNEDFDAHKEGQHVAVQPFGMWPADAAIRCWCGFTAKSHREFDAHKRGDDHEWHKGGT